MSPISLIKYCFSQWMRFNKRHWEKNSDSCYRYPMGNSFEKSNIMQRPLLGLYSVVSLLMLFGSPLYAANGDETPKQATGIPTAQDVLNRIYEQLPQLTGMLYAIVFILGLVFIFKGLVKLKLLGEQRSMMSQHGSLKAPLLYLLIGALLLYLPSTLLISTSTFWTTPCSYCYPTTPDSAFTPFFKVVYAVVNFVGLIAFVRGLVILSHTGEQSQQGAFAKAMTHIIGGILCMNIGTLVQTIFTTLGIKLT